MSSLDVLQSHSGLERTMMCPKHFVIVDERFKNLFCDAFIEEEFTYARKKYVKVPTLLFVSKGGFFKNFNE